MEQKNLEELYHKGELEWEEGEYTVCRGFQWTPPGCHNSCGILYYLKDGVMDHAEGDPLFPYNKRPPVRALPEPARSGLSGKPLEVPLAPQEGRSRQHRRFRAHQLG